MLNAGIVAGHDVIQPVLTGKIQHFIELHRAVAVDARVRCAARFVGGDELADDLLAEFLGVVHNLEGNVELERDLGGVLNVLG